MRTHRLAVYQPYLLFLCPKKMWHRRTDGWTDGRTDGPTDTPSYTDARMHLKISSARDEETAAQALLIEGLLTVIFMLTTTTTSTMPIQPNFAVVRVLTGGFYYVMGVKSQKTLIIGCFWSLSSVM